MRSNATIIIDVRYYFWIGLLICGVMALQRCSSDEIHTIAPHDRPFFESGDTLIFKDEFGYTDTLTVSLNQQFIDHDKGDQYERIFIRYQLLRKDAPIDAPDFLHVTQYVDGATISSRTYPFVLEESIEQFQLRDGTIIENVAVYDRSPQGPTYSEITSIYHNPHYGVVGYRYSSGAFCQLVMP